MTRTVIAGPDAFTGTDGTLLSVYSSNWQEQNNVTGYLKILSNAFHEGAGAQSDSAWKGTGSFTDDQYAEIDIVGAPSTSDTDNIGICLRNSGEASRTHDCYRIYWTRSNLDVVRVYKVVAGTATQLGTNISTAMSAGDKFSAEALANGANVDINVYRDTGGGPTLLGTRSDTSSVITGGKPGPTGIVGTGVLLGDNWTGGNITAASVDPGIIAGSASTFGLPGLIFS